MVLWGQSKECSIFYSNPTCEGSQTDVQALRAWYNVQYVIVINNIYQEYANILTL